MINNIGVTSKRGQVTIFIIIAVILIALVGMFFAVRQSIVTTKIPIAIEPVYNSFLGCVEESVLSGVDVLESQGGYIDLPLFEPGSNYMPFSSQLDFLGTAIPYWYYVSGNNIPKEQVPSKVLMQDELANFIESKIYDCDLSRFYEQGYLISQGTPKAEVDIQDNNIIVKISMKLSIEISGETYLVNRHDVSVNSHLGKLYDSAKNVYDQEQSEMFLEDYAVDNLRLYAPVDGIELTCSPKVWSADNIFNEIQQSIEDNTLTLKSKGGNFVLNSQEEEYFVLDLNIGANVEVKFINSKSWPNMFEVNPSSGNLLIADPIGIQPGLGILGFCYVPYHFIYDVRYPILVQVSEDDEIFQFPIAVVLEGNRPREPTVGIASEEQTFGLCENKNSPFRIDTYDIDLNPVSADISYECFGESCYIGKSGSTENFPQCVNGYVLARADGYGDSRELFSTNAGGNIQIIMEKLHEMNIDLKLDNSLYNGNAIIYFNSDEDSKVVLYPEQKNVELVSGTYEIQVYVYQDSSLEFEATTIEQCTEVPMKGLAGVLGLTEEVCVDIEMPSQIVSSVIAGGGKTEYYISESELTNFGTIEINSEGLPIPNTIEQLYNNYLLFEDKEIEVNFK